MSHEPTAIANWIADLLGNDSVMNAQGFTVANIFRNLANANTQVPYIVFSQQSGGTDDNTAGARNLARPLYFIKIVSDSSTDYGDFGTALSRMDYLLQNAMYESEDGLRISCKRDSTREYTEVPANGREYRHQGSLWRLIVSEN